MAPQDLLLHVFCLIDDQLTALNLPRLRRRGPDPTLTDSEVITIELVGEFWGLDADQLDGDDLGVGQGRGRAAGPGIREVQGLEFVVHEAEYPEQEFLWGHGGSSGRSTGGTIDLHGTADLPQQLAHRVSQGCSAAQPLGSATGNP